MKSTIVFEQIYDAFTALDEEGKRKYRYIILEGSSRSSKTRSLIQLFYMYAFDSERARLSVWRDTKKDCKDTILNDMQMKVFPQMPYFFEEVSFHKTESIYTFPTLTKIEICGTDDMEKVHGYEGDVLWLNEPYKIPRDVFDQLDQRTIDTVFIDWNPKQAHWIEDIKKDEQCFVIHSTFKDNPFCPENQRRKILSYQSVKFSHAGITLGEHPAKEYDIEKNKALFTEAQIKELLRCKENERKNSANDFNWSVYGLGLKAEKPNRIFHWTEISYDEYLKLDVPVYHGVDWGAVHPWGVLQAKYYDGGLYLHELSYISENMLRERLTPTQLVQINAVEEGLVTWYFNTLGVDKGSTIVCDNNRELKIKALRRAGYDYAIAAKKGPGSITDGIDVLNGMNVYYTHTSANLKYEQENYSRKVDRYGIILDEPEDLDNHLIDPARYIAEFLRSQGIIKTI